MESLPPTRMNTASTKPAIEHILLDMDGVVTDFLSRAMALHDAEDILQQWPSDASDAPEALGLSKEAFWKPIDALGPQFWETLPTYSWSIELVETLKRVAPVTILTNPGNQSTSCVAGKVQWLKDQLPGVPYLIGPEKHLCAKQGAVLIDDRVKNVASFAAAGGQTILFPQPWNTKGSIGNRLEIVQQKISEILAV